MIDIQFVVIYAEDSWSGICLTWGGAYPNFKACCEALPLARGMVYHVKSGLGVEIPDALALYNNTVKEQVTVHTITGRFWLSRNKWYEYIGENPT